MAGIFALVRSNWRGETAKLRNKEWFPCLFAVLDALAQPSGATAILSFFAAGWCRLTVVQTCMYIYIMCSFWSKECSWKRKNKDRK